MSTPSFGQPPAFGAGPATTPAPQEAPPPPRNHRTAVIVVAAGVVALGVLGGAAALVLGSSEEETVAQPTVPAGGVAPVVEPTAVPSAVSSPLPTALVQGRNVFVPLVEDEGSDAAVDAAAATAPAPSPSSAFFPTASPTSLPTTLPLLVPAPAVTQVVEVPGPTTVVTQPVPGPTVTTGPTQQVDRFAHQVEVVAVEPRLNEDDTPFLKESDGTPDSTATYRVNGTEYVVHEGEVFLTMFQHVDLITVPVEGGDEDEVGVMFRYASSVWTVPVGTNIGLGPR